MPRHKPDVSRHEHPRLLALAADVGRALTTRHTLADMLRGCAEALVENLDAALARVWALDAAQSVLVLRASAGLYTHLDGPHGRVPVGQFEIGRIAQDRRPHLTNAVAGDPRVPDQEWAAREGLVAFAGYPLLVEERAVGVAALFARRPLSDVTLQALESVADQIAVGIERSRAGEALRASEERYRAAFAHAAVGVTLADLHDCCLEANAAFCALTGYAAEELLHRDFPSLTHPDDLAESRAQMARLRAGEAASVVMEKRYVRQDGSTVWVQNSVALVRDADGNADGTIALTEDISRRKRAEAERAEAAARQRAFARDVLASVTDGRLVLCDGPGDLPAPLAPACAPVSLTKTEGLSELRQAVMAAARAAGHPEDRVGDLVIAVSEAGMNAIVHADAGLATVCVGDGGTVQVRVADLGGGITLENLPKATLARGFSTKASMGYGLKMMLETVDRLYLLTGPTGTTVVVEQERTPPPARFLVTTDEDTRVEEQVTQFVAQFLGVSRARLHPGTRIGHDLGVDGDDGPELMQAFAQHFGVDLSEFEAHRHFGPEAGADPMTLLSYLLFPYTRPRFVSITVGDLTQAAREGQWRTPDRDAA